MSDVVKRFYCHNNMMNPSACGAYVKYSYCQSLELENKRLREALEKHGKHTDACCNNYIYQSEKTVKWICICGFEQILGGKE